MDTQLKRGLLDTCVLAVLSKGESYGYKIISDLSDHIEISESTLYPILKKLEQSKCVTTRTAEHNGRLRKYYHITEAGLKRLEDFKDEWREVMSIYQFVIKGDGENE